MKKKNNKTKKKKKISDLYLDISTSHGGWPKGSNRGWIDKRPVNIQIKDYLDEMGLLDTPEHARLSESNMRNIIRKFIIKFYNY